MFPPIRMVHRRGAPPTTLTLASLAALATLVVADTALALGLGAPIQQSSLGQPLRLVIPVIAAPGEELAGECFRLAPGGRDNDGIPQVLQARVTLERSAAGAQLLVVSQRPINEPVVRVAIQAGCEVAVRRDYTLLLDPPLIEAPTVAAEASSRDARALADGAGGASAENTAALPGVAAPPEAVPGRGAARPAAKGGARVTPPRKAKRSAAAGKAAPTQRTPPRAATKPAPAAEARPRLRISAAPPAVAPPTAAGLAAEAQQAARAQELANALEAETVVLRQRVAELSEMVDRMQAEMKAATAARLAAEEAARNSPLAVATRWWESNWPILVAALGLASLIAGVLVFRRRRIPGTMTEWPITAAPPERFAAAPPVTQPPCSLTQSGHDPDDLSPAAGPAAMGVPAAAGATRRVDAAHAVAVSELSQVTEEARVYLALDRPDRAMAVLREHIADQPRSMPAAWLMLLDLYHTHGKEREFAELAEAFHQQFNAQTPTWASYPEHEANDAGIEAFPHVIRQLVNLWGTEDCRSYLERLLFDNRQGRRTGFSLVAYDDILVLRQLNEQLLAMPLDRDLEEEAKLRAAWAAAQHDDEAAALAAGGAAPSRHHSPLPPRETPPAPMLLDLELDLDSVIGPMPVRCCLEMDHPTVLADLTQEWGRPSVARHLRDLLVSEKKGAPQLSPEAVSELILLQRIALEISGPAGAPRDDAAGGPATRH